MLDWREKLDRRLTPEAAASLRGLTRKIIEETEEIRFRLGRKTEVVADGDAMLLDFCPDEKEMDRLIAALSGYARHAIERELAEGYLPLPGGHRAGVCGRRSIGPDGQARMTEIKSICLRIARHVPGASKPIRPYILDGKGRMLRMLLIGPPGCGKTTVLRDAALWLSDERGLQIGAADEREELFPDGPPEGEGVRLDVLSGAPKAEAMRMLLRSMAPQGIVTDEIGGASDAQALADAARCGVGLIATAHAGSLADAVCRPVLSDMLQAGTFDRIVLLGRHGACLEVCNGAGRRIEKEETACGIQR